MSGESPNNSEFSPLAVNQPFPFWAAIPDPAAGAVASYSVPGEWWVAVLAARATITTDANVANRFVSLDYLNGRGNTQVRNAAGLVVTASTTGQAFEWNAGRTVAEWATNTPVLAPCLDVLLPPASVIQVSIDSVQVGDQLSGVSLLLMTIETGPSRYPSEVASSHSRHR